MAPRVQEVRPLRTGRAASAGMTVPVILDSGDAARVAAIDRQGVPFVGMRFEHGGTVWKVTRAKDYLRGWVAMPVSVPGGSAAPARRPSGPQRPRNS